MAEIEKAVKSNGAPRNRTLRLTDEETNIYRQKIVSLKNPATREEIYNKTICGDSFEILSLLPEKKFDLLFPCVRF